MKKTNDVNSLRAALFETLEAVRNGNIDLERAKAINETAQSIINTAKVEVEYAKATGNAMASGFLGVDPSLTDADRSKSSTNTGIKTVAGNVTTHRLR